MRIIRADHLGMCFGVRDAIDLAKAAASVAPVTVLGELVHNQTVLDDLRSRGVQIASKLDQARTETVMITAHGASDRAIARVRASGKQVIEATCPLVHAAHHALKRLVLAGYHPVVVGKRDHVEVRGMTEDLAQYDVVLTEAEVMDLAPRAMFGIVAQTTQPIERVRYLAGLLRWRFPQAQIQFVDTVCQPTKQRQNAAIELASRVDVMIVAGGSNSNNTRELARTCSSYCSRVYQVESAGEIKAEWLDAAGLVGLTAGTSTPDSIIDEVELQLQALAESLRAREAVGAVHAS